MSSRMACRRARGLAEEREEFAAELARLRSQLAPATPDSNAAQREGISFKRVAGCLSESQCQNLALAALCVPYLLDSG